MAMKPSFYFPPFLIIRTSSPLLLQTKSRQVCISRCAPRTRLPTRSCLLSSRRSAGMSHIDVYGFPVRGIPPPYTPCNTHHITRPCDSLTDFDHLCTLIKFPGFIPGGGPIFPSFAARSRPFDVPTLHNHMTFSRWFPEQTSSASVSLAGPRPLA